MELYSLPIRGCNEKKLGPFCQPWHVHTVCEYKAKPNLPIYEQKNHFGVKFLTWPKLGQSLAWNLTIVQNKRFLLHFFYFSSVSCNASIFQENALLKKRALLLSKNESFSYFFPLPVLLICDVKVFYQNTTDFVADYLSYG